MAARHRILERNRELATLAEATQAAEAGTGSVVFIYGEAGIGKSSLVDASRLALPANHRFLLGYCDDLATRRTLGPFRDLVGSVGVELAEAVQAAADRDRVLAALRSELATADQPTVLVVEDVHWADEATLDALRFLVRRIAHLPVALVVTYRDDELTRDHPLHELLAEASSAPRAVRLPLQRLSRAAVEELSTSADVDPAHVYSVTSGNPFFVSQVIAAGDSETVPPTVVDAVLTRTRRLEAPAHDLVERLSVVPSALEWWLVDALAPGGVAALAAAEEHGLLTVSPERVAFRHELTRRAIVDSLPAARRIELNEVVLAVLNSHGEADLSRLVHHARQAGDLDAIVRFGPDAAREAARAGSHREAAAHYRLVLEQQERFPPAEQADMLASYAVECYTLGNAQEAVRAQTRAVGLLRSFGDPEALGVALRWLSRMHWWNGDRVHAEQAAQEAIEVLERAGNRRLLAMALSNRSQLLAIAYHTTASVEHGERAAALARETGDQAILAHALTNIGMARCVHGEREGEAEMSEALAVALSAGETEHALRAYVAISSDLLDVFRLTEARDQLVAGIDLADRAEQVAYLGFLTLERARLRLYLGDWDGVLADSQVAIESPQVPLRWGALLPVGRMRIRRALPDGDTMLAEAWALSVEMNELQRTGPIAAARAESAWLRGDLEAARDAVASTYAEARELGSVAYESELGYWLAKAGEPVTPAMADHPYAALARGEWAAAAEFFAAQRARYEQALALIESADPRHLLSALDILQRLGTPPLARIVRRRLRELGVAHMPRGHSRATHQNPAGLTERQVEVIGLVGEGLTNAEIAARLVVSVRTVETHIAVAMDKLGVRTRREAARRAADLAGGTGSPSPI
ncbi:AAA family ATPase [Kribbella sp. NPDC050470]|uniref:ATP-binding protein n=1 Tax=unclassified Kribbella TaxID=2644121 RepID=UPI0037B0D446